MAESHDAAIDDAVERLATRFPTLARDHVAQIVEEEFHRLDGSKVADFVPVIAERQAMDRLRTEAKPVPLSTSGEGPVLIDRHEHPDPAEKERLLESPSGPLLGNSGSGDR